MDVRVRSLPPEEWSKLLAFEPFASGGLPNPDQWRMIVAEEGATIVGFTGLFAGAHWEPWYLDPAARKHPGIARGLIREGLAVMKDLGIDAAYAVVTDDLPEQQALLERFGFTPAPGKLYSVVITDLEGF